MMNLSELLEQLLVKTREGKLSWSEFSDGDFFMQLQDLVISIEKGTTAISLGPNMKYPYFLRLRGSDYKVIETLRSSSDNYDALRDLYTIARRDALKIDASINRFKAMLDEI